LWYGSLPAEARATPDGTGPPAVRSESSLSAAELLPLIFIVPAFVLLAEMAVLLLNQHWPLVDLPSYWRRLLFAIWTVVLTMFLAAQAFRYWRRLQMDRATALLMLQDILWHETRGEQRRVQRWLAWRKLQNEQKKS
jgi:cbb3-type cytochrome oxidase subunit 3